MSLRVVYYARVSTDKEEQINSLENQVAFFEDYIRKNTNWTFVNGYVDEGISGTTSEKREHFMQMIEDAEANKFDLIITKEVSRFSRDTIDSLFYTRKLLEDDVCVYFLSDNIITASSDGELRLTIMSSMAQDEVRKISERTKFGFKRAISKGTVLGTDNIWGYKKDNGKLVIDEEEAPLIRDIFEIYANDSKIGLKKLGFELKKLGYLNRNGNPFHQNALKRIIQNPKYKGYYSGGLSTVVDYRSKKRKFYDSSEWKVYRDYEKVPPIVSEELWEKANQKLILRGKDSKGQHKYTNKYALSGKLYCDKHKCGFVRKVRHYKYGDDVTFWYCTDFNNTGTKRCVPACFKEADLYDILLSVFKRYEIYKEEICEELCAFYEDMKKQSDSGEQFIQLQNQLEKLESKKDKLLDLALDGLLSKDDLTSRKLTIEQQIEQIKTKLKELEHSKSKQQNQKQSAFKLKENILKELNITKENLESYIEGLLEKIIVKENEQGAELKIILSGNQLIDYCSETKPRKISRLADESRTDFKKLPLCYSNVHGIWL